LKKIIFDLDDTLIHTGIIYEKFAKKFVLSLVQDIKFNKLTVPEIIELQTNIDIDMIKKYGFKTERFPLSFAETYKFICGKYGYCFEKKLANKYIQIGNCIFETVPEIIDGTLETLKELKRRSYELIIYTLGEKKLQEFKILKNKLNEYVDDYFIVEHKNKETLLKICGEVAPAECAIAGDSLKGEVAPGVELGLKTFYIKRPRTWSYLYTKVDGNYWTISSIKQMLEYL
jgi:putative hydrolase of the HAD superfamily